MNKIALLPRQFIPPNVMANIPLSQKIYPRHCTRAVSAFLAPGVKLKPKATQWHPRTHGPRCWKPSTPHVLRWWDPSDWLQLRALDFWRLPIVGFLRNLKTNVWAQIIDFSMPHGARKFWIFSALVRCVKMFLFAQSMMNSMAKKPHILSSCAERCGICQSLIYDFQTWFLEPDTGPVDPSFVGCLSWNNG